ncbi:MAG: c-type cytochrome [Alsobacter sp.]
MSGRRAGGLAVLACLAVPAMAVPARAAMAPPGATSCSGCHGASPAASVGPVLRGRPAQDLAAAMLGFRDGTTPATVMDRIAKGFSPEEIQAIAAWVAAQP